MKEFNKITLINILILKKINNSHNGILKKDIKDSFNLSSYASLNPIINRELVYNDTPDVDGVRIKITKKGRYLLDHFNQIYENI